VDDLTTLLAAARDGDEGAAAAAFSLMYNELRKLARAKLRVHQTMTLLDTTSLVHESYLRLVGSGRAQIFAREKLAERRGGGQATLLLDTAIAESASATEDDVIRLHDALVELAGVNARLVSVVEMRYFGGLTEREIADVLGVSERTVKRDWEKARLLLRAALR
jgi:RNA polymerase sigma factor (sigma-70 family)